MTAWHANRASPTCVERATESRRLSGYPRRRNSVDAVRPFVVVTPTECAALARYPSSRRRDGLGRMSREAYEVFVRDDAKRIRPGRRFGFIVPSLMYRFISEPPNAGDQKNGQESSHAFLQLRHSAATRSCTGLPQTM